MNTKSTEKKHLGFSSGTRRWALGMAVCTPLGFAGSALKIHWLALAGWIVVAVISLVFGLPAYFSAGGKPQVIGNDRNRISGTAGRPVVKTARAEGKRRRKNSQGPKERG